MRNLLIPLVTAFATNCVATAEPEIGPPPRPAEKQLQFEQMTGGYKLHLSRNLAERLRDRLARFDNEKDVGEFLRDVAKDIKDEKTSASVELLSYSITNEMPKFKKSLDENMGENGVTITVYGLRRGKDRPVLRAIGKSLIPPELHEEARALLAIAKTQPLYWKIESR